MADIIDGKRINDLEHAIAVSLSMRFAIDNPAYSEAKYITIEELAAAIGSAAVGSNPLVATPNLFNYDVTTDVFTGLPYANKKVADPGYAYFHTDGNVYPEYENLLVLDGFFTALELKALSGDGVYYEQASVLGSGFYLQQNNALGNHALGVTMYSGAVPFAHLYANKASTGSLPIYIGSIADAGEEHGEYIMFDDDTRLFELNVTNIQLTKGTASTWLGLDANKRIIYNPAPTTLTPLDDILTWDGTKYVPYAIKKETDPNYPYFYISTSDMPSYTNNLLCDAHVYATRFSVYTNPVPDVQQYTTFDNTGISFNYVELIGAKIGIISNNGDVFNIDATYYNNLTTISTPIIIGAYTIRNQEHIIIDDYNQLFNINMTTIKLSKGTASKWLALNANKEIEYLDAPSSSGSVLSVGLLLPADEFTITNSPVTVSGTLTGSWALQNPNTIFAGPTMIKGIPSFRSLIASDIPSLPYDNYSNWDIKVNSGTALGIYKTGSASTYKGVNLVAGSNMTLTTSSGIDGFFTVTLASSGGASGVTSVGLSMPSIFTVIGSPITTSGTLAASLNVVNPNKFLAGLSNPLGGDAVPTFRYLTANDIPALPYDNYGSWDVEIGTLGKRAIYKSGTTTPNYGSIRFLAGTGITLQESSIIGNVFGVTIASSLAPSGGLTNYMTYWDSDNTIYYLSYNRALINAGLKALTYGQIIGGTISDSKNTALQIQNLNSGNTYLPYLCLYKANGTGAMASGDILGQLIFSGKYSSSNNTDKWGAYIQAITTAAWSTSSQHETKLQFMISKAGETDPLLAFEINKFGILIETTHIQTYANNAAAITGGLSVGQVYRTSTGTLMTVY